MIINVNIPAAHGIASTTLVIDTDRKVQAIKDIRSLGSLGLKEAKDLLDAFLAFPNPQAEAVLVNSIIDVRQSPADMERTLRAEIVNLRCRLDSALDRVRAVDDNNRRLNAEVAALQDERIDPEQVRKDAQDAGFPVVYHGSLRDVHGVYTAFYDNDGTYRLVHPAPTDSGDHLKGVSYDSFTALRGCEPSPF